MGGSIIYRLGLQYHFRRSTIAHNWYVIRLCRFNFEICETRTAVCILVMRPLSKKCKRNMSILQGMLESQKSSLKKHKNLEAL
jgi:hypothetical protein